jgi:hypothetical protein
MEYKGCVYYRTQRSEDQSTTLTAFLPRLAGGEGWGSMVFIVMEAEKRLRSPRLEQKCAAASYCQLQLHLYFARCDGNMK